MAEGDTSTSAEVEATTSDFDPEELAVPTSKAEKSQESEPPTSSNDSDEWDDDEEEGATPSTQPTKNGEISKESEPPPSSSPVIPPVVEKKTEEKKTEKKKSEEKKPEEKKPVEKKEENVEEEKLIKDEKLPEEKPKSKLVKVKLGEEEYDVPEPVAEGWNKLVTKAKEIISNHETLKKNLFGDLAKENDSEIKLGTFTTNNLQLLAEHLGGNKEKAYERLIQEYAAVIDHEIKFRSLPEAEQRAIKAENELKRIKEEQKAKEEAEKARIEEEKRAVEIESMMTEVRDSMTELGLELNADNRELGIRTCQQLEFLRSQGKNPSIPEVIKFIKNEIDREQAERDQRAVASIKSLPYETLAQRYPELVKTVRSGDLASLKGGKASAKTSAKSLASSEERSSEPRSKKKILSGTDWDSFHHGR